MCLFAVSNYGETAIISFQLGKFKLPSTVFPFKVGKFKSFCLQSIVTSQRSDPTVAWIEAIIRFVNVLSASRQHKLSASSAGLRSTFIGVLCIKKKTFNLFFSR